MQCHSQILIFRTITYKTRLKVVSKLLAVTYYGNSTCVRHSLTALLKEKKVSFKHLLHEKCELHKKQTIQNCKKKEASVRPNFMWLHLFILHTHSFVQLYKTAEFLRRFKTK